MGFFDPPPRVHKLPHPFSRLERPRWWWQVYLANLAIWILFFHAFWLLWFFFRLFLWRGLSASWAGFVLIEGVLFLLGFLVAHLMSYKILFLLRDRK